MKRFLVACALALFARVVPSQTNTTAATAADYFWGQKASSRIDLATPTQFWFALAARQGRGYCVEAGNFVGDSGAVGDKFADPELTVYQADHVTVIASNDDATQEPFGRFLSRACWVHNLPSQEVLVKLFPNPASFVPSSAITLRFVETTLFCNWFFIAGDYNAFSLIRNTADTPLPAVVVTWRGLNGAVAGTTTVALPANATVIVNARDFVNPAVFSNGSVEIAHPGSPEQIWASTTTLSGTTGLGFDAPFGQRKPW